MVAAFARDGNTLATGSIDSTVVLWDLSDRTQPRRLGQPITGAGVVAEFSPDGQTLATRGERRTAILWDVSDPTQPRRLGQPLTHTSPEMENGPLSVVFAPNSHMLATIGVELILWDISDRAKPRRLGQPLTGSMSGAFAPDGNTLATGNWDSTVTLWDLSNQLKPRRLGQPLTGQSQVITLAFTPDGNTLATGSFDRMGVLLWGLANLNNLRRRATDRACSITRRGLDREEWSRHVLVLPYESTCPS